MNTRPYQTRNLTDAQWVLVEPLIPKLANHHRPPISRRDVLNGILYVLRTGIPWKEMPRRYPSAETCHRQYTEWVRYGVMKAVLEGLAQDLRKRGGLDIHQLLASATAGPDVYTTYGHASGSRGQRGWRPQTAELLLSIRIRNVLR